MTRKNAVKQVKAPSPAEALEAKVQALGDWRGRTLARVREAMEMAY